MFGGIEFKMTARKQKAPFRLVRARGDLIIYFGIAAIKLKPRADTANHGPSSPLSPPQSRALSS